MYLVKNSKSKNYQIVHFVKGKRTTVSTRTSSKKEAIHFFKLFMDRTINNKVDKKEKVDEKKEVESKPEHITIKKFRKEYVDYVTPIKSLHYIKSIELSFRQFLYFTGDLDIKRIDPRLIDKFIMSTFCRTQRGAQLYFRTLKAAFSKAVTWGYIEDNPFKKIKFPQIPKNYPIFITEEEFSILISHTPKNYLKDLFTTAFNTGMRLGELVNMRWSWIDLNEKIITIKNGEGFHSKGKKERIIPISSTVFQIIERRQGKVKSEDPNGYLFCKSSGWRYNEDYISKQFKRVVRSAKLNDKIHFHTLRHSFASRLVQKGVSLYVVKELLGHEDLSTTQIYSHLQSQNLRDAVNLL